MYLIPEKPCNSLPKPFVIDSIMCSLLGIKWEYPGIIVAQIKLHIGRVDIAMDIIVPL